MFSIHFFALIYKKSNRLSYLLVASSAQLSLKPPQQLKQRLLAVQKTHEMLEDMRTTIADARMHVLVSHPEPDPGDLGGGLLGDIEVHVHVLVVDRSSYRNLQDAIHACLASPNAANFLKHIDPALTPNRSCHFQNSLRSEDKQFAKFLEMMKRCTDYHSHPSCCLNNI